MIRADAPFVVFDEIDSTNEEARRRAAAGDAEPVWLLAKRQTAGRGRMGRAWLTLPGNMFLTYYGLSARPASDIALLGFAAGVALAETCAPLISGRASLKWPNDLLIDGRKAAGILLESGQFAHGAGGRLWFAVGVGLNIARAPQDVGQETAALNEFSTDALPTPIAIAQTFAARLAAWSARLENEGFTNLRTAWEASAHGLGEIVRVQIAGEDVSGRASGLSPRGELILALQTGETRLISAGDVYFPAAAPAP